MTHLKSNKKLVRLTMEHPHYSHYYSSPSNDEHWIKYMRFSTKVKDEEGFPSFALVNMATGHAIKHSIGVSHPGEVATGGALGPSMQPEMLAKIQIVNLWATQSSKFRPFRTSYVRIANTNNISVLLVENAAPLTCLKVLRNYSKRPPRQLPTSSS